VVESTFGAALKDYLMYTVSVIKLLIFLVSHDDSLREDYLHYIYIIFTLYIQYSIQKICRYDITIFTKFNQ